MEFNVLYSTQKQISPNFFQTITSLGGIGNVRWSNDPLAKPDVKTFVHLSLRLPRNCPVWEVYRLISASANSVGYLITVTQVLIMQ